MSHSRRQLIDAKTMPCSCDAKTMTRSCEHICCTLPASRFDFLMECSACSGCAAAQRATAKPFALGSFGQPTAHYLQHQHRMAFAAAHDSHEGCYMQPPSALVLQLHPPHYRHRIMHTHGAGVSAKRQAMDTPSSTSLYAEIPTLATSDRIAPTSMLLNARRPYGRCAGFA
jgi:hypothetical protein